MIPKKELKLDNWVYFTGNGNDNPVQIKELGEREMIVDYVGNKLSMFYTQDTLQPIPLSPKILERCGFEKGTGEFYSQYKLVVDEWLTIYVNEEDFSLEFWGLNESVTPTCYWFKYLHQLQNLIYSLTGEELKITL